MTRTAVCLLLATLPAVATAQVGVSGRIGTTGAVLEAGVRLGNHLGVRANTAFGSWSYRQRISGISYEATLKFNSQSAILDFYPSAGGSFHLSGGVATAPIDASATGTPTLSHTFVIGNHLYSEAQVGTLSASTTWDDMLPYAGIGWSGGQKGARFTVVFDIGAVIGTPTVKLAAAGGTAPPTLAADLELERASVQHDIDRYLKAYPVMSFGIRLRF